MPPILSAEPAEVAEAQLLLDALQRLITNAGEAYVELSGQTAATQAVVADLRRCGLFLQKRLAGGPPPAPWLSASERGAAVSSNTSPIATPPVRRESFSQGSSLADANPPLGGDVLLEGFRSPPPALSTPGGSYSPVAAPASSAAAPEPRGPGRSPAGAAAITPASGRPPLAGGGPGAAGRAATVGRAGPAGRPPAAAPRNLASMPAAGRPSGAAASSRARDASPQRRAGVGRGTVAAGPAVPLRSASPASTPQACRAPSPSSGGEGRARSGASLVDQGPATDTSSTAAAAADIGGSSAGGRGGDSFSHLPLAAQRAMAAAAALAGQQQQLQHQQQQQQSSGGPESSEPPQLPLALRRAMQRYRDTLQTRDQLLQQFRQRRGTSNNGGAGCSPSLADTVGAAGRSYRSALTRQYPSVGNGHQAAERGRDGGSVGAGASQAAAQLSRMSFGSAITTSVGSIQSTAELQRRAQVTFAALVAAQTWLTRSLSELARSRGTPGGVAAANRRVAQADACAALLTDVELLHQQLGELQAQVKATAEASREAVATSPSLPAAAPAAGICGRAGNSGSTDPLAVVAAGLGCDREELEEAAALWRNRFLRAMLCDPAGPGARRGQGGPQQHPPQSRQPDLDALGAGPCMRQPLGFWLLDTMWPQVPLQGEGASAEVGKYTAASEPPWHVLLPASVQPNAAAALAPGITRMPGAAVARTAAAPPPLICASAQDAVAHGRAQLQLQSTVFQLLLEGSLAAPLLPRQRPPHPERTLAHVAAGRNQLQHQHQHRAAALAWERWLAQCRLAHLLLFKGSWNRMCSVVQLEDEEQVGDEADGERM